MSYAMLSNACRRSSGGRANRRLYSAIRVVAIFGISLAVGVCGRPAQAAVLVNGNVLPADDPFTLGVDEGIPIDGNFIDPFSPATDQVFFEGRPNAGGTANENFNIIVGETAFGTMLISGESALRDMNLVIGDMGTLPNGQTRRGTGVVRITGFGSLYNNDPEIIPPGLPTNFSSVNPRAQAAAMDGLDDATDGFDLYVGRAGFGTLEISVGGRAEIQDAVVVGDTSGSVGTLIVTGTDAFLGSGGFGAGVTGGQNVVHHMVIGRRGTGTMTISAGGQVVAMAADTGAQQDVAIAAVIGGDPFENNDVPEAGGQGTVEVTGTASRWITGGTLQVGGFHNVVMGAMEDLAGIEVQYPDNVGRGTLNVYDGGSVNIVSPSAELTPGAIDELDLVIGRLGRINLLGGTITLDPGLTDEQSPDTLIDRVRVINDGVISGSGRITAGQFRNRVLGDVRVGADQKLLIQSTGAFADMPNQEYPLSNYGLMEVLGTPEARAELEIDRVPGTTAAPVRPLRNLRLPMGDVGANGRTAGQIVAQDAILRFRSGIENHGNVLFTGGSNVVSGEVLNDVDGVIYVGGDNTTVTFEDDVTNLGSFQLQPNISLITINNNFMMAGSGSLSTTFGGRPTGQEISHLSAAGDVTLGGLLTASLFVTGSNQFSPQPGDIFEIIRAGGELIGDFDNAVLPCPNANMCFFGFPDYDLDAYFIATFSFADALGADFNGDGIVDEFDLAIWRQFLGQTGPPGTLPGDANGDGVVNGQDFFIWQMQVGMPGAAVPGGGSGQSAGQVPEPNSIALVAISGVLALAWRRRRPAH